jgi:hypothetical protein
VFRTGRTVPPSVAGALPLLAARTLDEVDDEILQESFRGNIVGQTCDTCRRLRARVQRRNAQSRVGHVFDRLFFAEIRFLHPSSLVGCVGRDNGGVDAHFICLCRDFGLTNSREINERFLGSGL